MPDDKRSIELEVEVAGTAEQVWQAIATGPGISSWYVPHTVEERTGGAMTASFGPGPEMQVTGRVAAWEPPRRVAFDGGEGVEGLAFEWLVQARDGGSCVVRLVNTGFEGDDWDAQYDGMAEGWQLFLINLRLHLAHFPGQAAIAVLPMTMWAGPREAAWTALNGALGIPPDPAVGSRVEAAGGPPLAGTVVHAAPGRLAMLLDRPCPGTAFLAVEGGSEVGAGSEQVAVSVWSYLYGPDAASIAARQEPAWRQWLAERAPSAG